MVERSYRRARNVRESHPKGREWLIGTPKEPGVVEMPSRSAGGGQVALLEGRGWSRGPPERLGVVERPSRKAGRGRETFPKAWQWLGCTL